jgi:hypothetical protein
VGSEKDNLKSCPEAEELLPARGAELEASCVSEEPSAHAQGCPQCGELLRARVAVADELRLLPRASAPAAGETPVDFAFVMGAVRCTLDAELAREEARLRPLLGRLARLVLPAAATSAARAALLAKPHRLPRVLQLVRQVAALAAAAGVVAAALLSRSAPDARNGLAAETRSLSGSVPIRVDLVDAPSPADSIGAARFLGHSGLPLEGGGP